MRIVTYNIRSCRGLDGRYSVDRIVEVLASLEPDIVALQEVDVDRARTDRDHQADLIADRLGMRASFGPSFLDDEHGSYGNVVLSRRPATIVGRVSLPRWGGAEPRTALRVRIDAPRAPIDVVNTHLGFRAAERMRQARSLRDWLSEDNATPGLLVVCGDLNCVPGSPSYRAIADGLADAQVVGPHGRPRATWPSRLPFRRIDHLLVSPDAAVAGVRVPWDRATRIASDHLPVAADLLERDANDASTTPN